MTALTADEMRDLSGGKTYQCGICGTYKSQKFSSLSCHIFVIHFIPIATMMLNLAKYLI